MGEREEYTKAKGKQKLTSGVTKKSMGTDKQYSKSTNTA